MSTKRKSVLYIHDAELKQPFVDDVVLLDDERHMIHVDPRDAIIYIDNIQRDLWDKVDRNLDIWFANQKARIGGP